jgi:hypothetical protein
MLGLIVLLAAASPAASPPAPIETPVTTTAAIDPARFAIARRIVTKVLGPGRFQQITAMIMYRMIASMEAQRKRVTIMKLLPIMNAPLELANKIPSANIDQIEAILDPSADRRAEIMNRVMLQRTADLAARFEPQMAEAMATAYARHFDLIQLTDIARFFDTPGGATFAAENMSLGNDPAITELNARMLAYVGERTPAMVQEMIAAQAPLPQPREFSQLNQAERLRIADLIGITPEK